MVLAGRSQHILGGRAPHSAEGACRAPTFDLISHAFGPRLNDMVRPKVALVTFARRRWCSMGRSRSASRHCSLPVSNNDLLVGIKHDPVADFEAIASEQ